MAQKVIASKDVDIYLLFDAIPTPIKVETGTSLAINITGDTEDIAAISTAEPIATDNGSTQYDLTLSMQTAEAISIKDALATATAGETGGSIAHIRQIVEGASISVVYKKLRDTPATSSIETYTACTGMEENDSTERSSTETIKTWRFRARGMRRVTTLL